MNNIKTIWIGILIAIVIAVGGYVFPAKTVSTLLGGGTRFPNGISADSTSPSAGQVRGTTLTTTGASTFGGTVTVTTTNTATSTVKAGCFQMNATSTATPGRLVLASSGATTTYGLGGSSVGVVAWQYGSCP